MRASSPIPWYLFLIALGIYWTSSLRADEVKVTLTPATPRVLYPTYPNDHPTHCVLTAWSDSFSKLSGSSPDLKLRLDDRPEDVTVLSAPPKPAQPHTVYGVRSGNSKQIDLYIPWSSILNWRHPYHGNVMVRVGVNGDFSDPEEIVISGVQSQVYPLICALATSLIVLGIPIFLVSRSRKTYMVADRPYGVLASFFLDPETDSYSLSKFQFYSWTAAGVFGYFTLTISQSLVQAKFVFADIPPGLPGIILISAATAATSQAMTGVKGSKGAGPIYPSVADFVSTGGIVVPERFQFFIWTIVGLATFLFLVVFSNPATIKDLPSIPNGFLVLMGISSSGYLGGKLARKPGPNVGDVAAGIGSLVFKVRGRKLSPDATFRIDGMNVKSTDTIITAGAKPDDTSQPPEFYMDLSVLISQPDESWLSGGKHLLSVINPDGQSSDCNYDIPSKPVCSATATTKERTLTLVLVGSELSAKATVKIDGQELNKSDYAPSGAPSDKDSPASELFNKITLTITNPQPEWLKAGSVHQLVLVNPDKGTSAATSFSV